jgi:hypothetical protein
VGIEGREGEESTTKNKTRSAEKKRSLQEEREDCRNSRDVQSLIAMSRGATRRNKHSRHGQAGLKADGAAPAIPKPSIPSLIRRRKNTLA